MLTQYNILYRANFNICYYLHMNRISTGRYGEQLAKEYLIKQGYKIVESNKHFSKFCEIDIIALDKNTLVFAEVKTRKTTAFGLPQEAVTKTKYQNIKNGIYFYLQENPEYKKFRIDVISIVLEPEIEIKHFKNV